MAFRSMTAEQITFRGYHGDNSEAYCARPDGSGPFPGVVVIHHFPGCDEWTATVRRKFAHHGYPAIASNLYIRLGDGGDEAVVAQATPEHVNRTEAELRRPGKNYEFHRDHGAGHAFFAWYRPNHRQEQAQDGWQKVFASYARHLAT